MNALEAVQYLIQQRKLGLLGDHSAIATRSDRLMVLGLGLRLAGYQCETCEQKLYISKPTQGSTVLVLQGLCVALGPDHAQVVGIDGAMGAQAIAKDHLSELSTIDATASEVDDNRWEAMPMRPADEVDQMEQSPAAQDRHCAAIARLCAASLQAHAIALSTPDCAPAKPSARRI